MARSDVIITGFLLSFCLASVGTAQQSDSELRDEAVQRLLEAMPPDTVTDADVFEANGFRVTTAKVKQLGANLQPNGTEFQSLEVTAKGVLRVGVYAGQGAPTAGGVTLFHRDAGTPMLDAVDRDGDGRIDLITYTVVDEQGEQVGTVVDYEADGQSDMRYGFGRPWEIWHLDRWYSVENRDGVRTIVVDGESRQIVTIDNRPVVQ